MSSLLSFEMSIGIPSVSISNYFSLFLFYSLIIFFHMGKNMATSCSKNRYLSNIVSPGERVSFRNFYDKNNKSLHLLSMGHSLTPEFNIVVIMNDVS